MKILVYGAGAVGGYVGSLLRQQKHNVTLVARNVTGAMMEKHGLMISTGGQTQRVRPTVVPSIAAAFMNGQQYDLIIMAMKAYDLRPALDPLVAFCAEAPPLLTLQSGIGGEELLAKQFGAEKVIAGAFTLPIRKESANHLQIPDTDRGLALAPIVRKGNIKPWLQLFKETGLPTTSVRDYRALKWSQVFWQSIGNASAAILNRKPRLIFKSDTVYELEVRMLHEMVAVMEAAGIKLVDLPGITPTRLAFGLKRLPDTLFKPMLVRAATDGRDDHMPSFYTDLNAGKGKNEVAFHNGAAAQLGEELGIAMPVNGGLTEILWRLTIQKMDWRDFDGRPKQLLRAIKQYRASQRLSRKRVDDSPE
jgi:2-dehydropantoate 2-reductase